MAILVSLSMILGGAALMAYGLFIFYAWLPILYGLIGFETGILLGNWLIGEISWAVIVLGIVGALILGAASYFLEPLRRVLLGVSSGFMLGLAIATLLGLQNSVGGIVGLLLATIFGFVGARVVPRWFDMFVVAASAVGGAAMVMNGAHSLFPGIALFDRSTGGFLPSLLAFVLAAIGMIWQVKNISYWFNSLGVTAGSHGGDGKRPTKAD